MAKKDFTRADGAVERFFSKPTQGTNDTHDTIVTNDTKHTHDTHEGKPPNTSKHYDQRGPRGERFGLLMDSRLKDDLTHLSKVTGCRSVNDLIVTVLLAYVEREENQAKLARYRALLQGEGIKSYDK